MGFVVAASAAVDILAAITAKGQDDQQQRRSLPAWARWGDARDKMRWEELKSETDRLLRVLADQARASLTVSWEPPEQGEAREGEDDDGSAGWVKAISTARREWWARLEPSVRAEAEAAVQAYRKVRRERARARIERMRRILSAYHAGSTADEIGQALGLGARGVREFAARRGVTVTRAERRVRLLTFDAREEGTLRALAADFGATPTEVAQAILKAALESDAHPARRMLGVRRRILAAA
jgi:hypothetical protein